MLHLDFILDGHERRITIRPGTQILGRSGTSDILVSHPSVSSQHISVTLLNDNTLHIKDLMSRNGLVVNEQKVPEAILRHGDVMRLGKIRLQVVDDEQVSSLPASGETLIMQDSPHTTHSDPYLRPATIQLLAPEGVCDDETPPAGIFLPELRASGGGVQVIMPASSVVSDDGGARRRKRLIHAAAGIVALVALVIMVLPPEKPPVQGPAKPVYRKADYERKLVDGIERFQTRRYAEAERSWGEAQTIYGELYPTKSDDRASRVLLRIAKAYREADANHTWETLRWMDLAQEARDLDEVMVLPDEVADFVNSLYRDSIRENAAVMQLAEGRTALAEKRHDDAVAAAAQVPPESSFAPAAAELIRTARDAAYAQAREEIVLTGKAGNWETAITKAQALLRQRDDVELRAQVRTWMAHVADRDAFARATRLVEQGGTDRLQEALTVLKDIGPQSLRHDDARTLETRVNNTLVAARMAVFYRAGNIEGLSEMLSRHPDSETHLDYEMQLRRMQSMQKALASADKLIAEKKYFDARRVWNSVQAQINDKDNHYHIQAGVRLNEWSLERIADIYIKQGNEAFLRKDYRAAREAYLIARNDCKADVDARMKALQDEGKRLFDEGRNLIVNDRIVSGVLLLEQARDCVEPSNPMYHEIEQRLKQVQK